MLKLLLLTTALVGATTPNTLTPEINYTADSVIQEGISCEIEEVILGEASAFYLRVTVDMPLGYEVYDDPVTSYIEGIKVGEDYLPDSYSIGKDDYNELLTITVKTVYAKGVAGTLAAIGDGNYNFSKWFEGSPIVIMQFIYYGISVISIVLGGIGIFKSKKYKAITSKDWANTADKKIDKAVEDTKKESEKITREILATEFLPLVKQLLSNDQNIIKAVALQSSKAKDAPDAILDLLMKVSTDVNTAEIINDTKKAIKEKEDVKEKAIEETKKALAEIVKENSVDVEGRY